MKKFQRWMMVCCLASAFQAGAADSGAGTVFADTVVDAQGRPVAGAEVDFHEYPSAMAVLSQDEGVEQHTNADSSGAFAFSTAGGGTSVVAKKTGLAPAWRTTLYNPGDSIDPLVLTTSADLTGLVVDEKDRPVADAEVWVSMALDKDSSLGQPNFLVGKLARDCFSAQTGADGHFHIPNFPAEASANLSVTKPGWAMRGGGSPLMGYAGNGLPYHPGKNDIKLVVVPAGTIEGKVMVAETGRGLSGVTLSCVQSGGGMNPFASGARDSAQSGADGSFRIPDLAPGSYNIVATFAGKPVAEWVAEKVPIAVEAGETARNAEVKAIKGGMAVVTVVSKDDQKPMANVAVTSYEQVSESQSSTSTGPDGVAHIRLTPGQWMVVASKPGWGSDGNPPPVAIEAGQTNTVQLELSPPLKITGIVRDPAGAPVAGARVSVGPSFGGNAEFKTDAKGRYEVTWLMQSMGQNFVYSITARSAERKLAVTHDIDDTITNLDLTLQPGLTLSVRVANILDKPITNATATLMLFSGNAGFQMNTQPAKADNQGRIRIEALPQGQKYSLAITAPGYGSANQQAEAAETLTTLCELPPVVLNHADFKLAGQVFGADGKPAAGVNVNLNGVGQPNGTVQTDAKGHFAFDAVCEGPINLFANSQGSFGNAQASGGDTNVILNLQDNNTRQAMAMPSQKIMGRVTDPSGAPVAGVRLSLFPNWGGNNEARTDANGKYSLNVQQQIFQMGGPNMTPAILARSLERNLAAAHEIDESTTNLDLRLENGLTLVAKVEDAKGKPISAATASVLFYAGNNSFPISMAPPRADAQGRIEIKALAQGQQYNLDITASGYGMASQVLASGDSQTTRHEFPTIVLKLANRKLAGQVLGVDGKPAAGAQVQINGEGQPNGNTRTDAKGHFSFPAVCEGAVRIFAYLQGGPGGVFQNANTQAQGGDTNVVVRFGVNNNMGGGGKQLTTAGAVFDASGAPAAGVLLSVVPNFYGGNFEIRSDSDGKYSISWQTTPMNQGGGRRGGAPGPAYLLVARDVDKNFAAAQELTETTTNLDIRLQPGFTVKGSVQDANGQPLRNASVNLNMMVGNRGSMLGQSQVRVDEQGQFAFAALPQGEQYFLNVSINGYGSGSRTLQPAETQTTSLELPAFQLKRADRPLEGQVVGPDDKPISGALVFINGQGQPNGNARTDSKGHFAFKVCDGPIMVFANNQNGSGNGNAQAQGGDMNVIVKFGANRQVNNMGRQAAPRNTPLKYPLWSWDGVKNWPVEHPKAMVVLLCAQLVVILGTAGGLFWFTRNRGI